MICLDEIKGFKPNIESESIAGPDGRREYSHCEVIMPPFEGYNAGEKPFYHTFYPMFISLREWLEENAQKGLCYRIRSFKKYQKQKDSKGSSEHDIAAFDDPLGKWMDKDDETHEQEERKYIDKAFNNDCGKSGTHGNFPFLAEDIGAQKFPQMSRGDRVGPITDD
jgi:hypothetical protein